MRRVLGLCFVVGMLAGPSMADLNVTGLGYGMTNSYGLRGGEFKVSVDAPVWDPILGVNLNLGSFKTFCVEYAETLSIPTGGPYDIKLSDAAVYNNIPGNSDPLSGKTAWLFCEYAHGSIVIGTNAQAAAFQNAIWYLEDAFAPMGGDQYYGFSTNVEVKGLIDGYLSMVAGIGDDDPIGCTRVINMWSNNHVGEYAYRKQDLLVCVPAPAAVVLGMLGLGLVGWVKRRMA